MMKRLGFSSNILQSQPFCSSETETRNPRLAEAFHLPHGETRRFLVIFASNTWDDDILPFRESLINVERYVSLLCSTKPISNSVFI
jgi:hypothetical protein